MSLEYEKGKLSKKQGGIEFAPKPDFRKILLRKLEKIEPIPEQDEENCASVYESIESIETIGIKKLKREVPALLFIIPENKGNNQSFDLWITNPKIITDNIQPHDEVRKDLANFLGIDTDKKHKYDFEDDSRFPKYSLGAILLQDDSDQLYLLVDEIRSERIKMYLKKGQRRIRLFDFLQRYDIKKIAGHFRETQQEGDTKVAINRTRTIVNQDFLGEKREDLQLLNIALKYRMTNTQFMRFSIRAKASIDAVKKEKIKDEGFILSSLEEIAKEIVDEDKE